MSKTYLIKQQQFSKLELSTLFIQEALREVDTGEKSRERLAALLILMLL